ncbi:restriction endonuclease [Melissococcus sp. OM08-11BH]|uniref:restriction endonuclease n=1 Tax=Melissococcus sp. OM08-11BH TaxID=2293110 RepID=UPI000E53C41D|nr:restriction endonuclease [Melissococcus sp. OM08-11BH]RGI29678.1 hypothetical protein DXC12_07310 [Melissococcus sp. OM08-11BH]
MASQILDENDVVNDMKEFLKTQGYKIKNSCNTNQKGVDIVAEKGEQELWVEAKGGTSSKKNSSRYGLPFTTNQVKVHVSRAIYQALSALDSEENPQSAIALPDDEKHRQEIEKVRKSLEKLGIDVYFVSKERGVQR